MNLEDRQLRVLDETAASHHPAHRAPGELRLGLRRASVAASVPAERLSRRNALAEAVGDPFLNERLIGTMDLLPVNFLERGIAAARTVCRLELKDSLGRFDGAATGLLVGHDLLLTNHHVLPDAEHAQRSLAQLDYADGPSGDPLASHMFRLDPARLFCTDAALDYTLVAVCPLSLDKQPLSTFGASPLVSDPGKAILSEHLNIVQHPEGQTKQVAIRHNELTEENDDFLFYLADTAPGSSGSPVFNDAWLVVALHVAGVPALDDQGRYLDRETGAPIEGKPRSLAGVRFVSNRGVRVSRIFQSLKSRADLDDRARALALSVFKTTTEILGEAGKGLAAPPSAATTEPAAAVEIMPREPDAPAARRAAPPPGEPRREPTAERELFILYRERSGPPRRPEDHSTRQDGDEGRSGR
ncbi:MAG: serine protease [Byssovorax sp.]